MSTGQWYSGLEPGLRQRDEVDHQISGNDVISIDDPDEKNEQKLYITSALDESGYLVIMRIIFIHFL